MAEDQTRQCPYCKETINARALKCKHCGSSVQPTLPDHDGVCPFCKESIHPEAVICPHCRSQLVGAADIAERPTSSGCGCSTNRAWAPGTARLSEELAATAVGLSAGATSVAARRPQCDSWCVGSTLMCACRVRVPGMGEGIVIYPCGTCIDDPGPIITAAMSRLGRN
jgi:uncharacterized CHY-type Zn-finger protein